MEWLQLNLQYFSSSQVTALITTVTEDRFSALDPAVQSDIEYLFFQLKPSTPTATIDALYDCLMEAVLLDEDFWIERVNEGSSFFVNIEKEGLDATDLKIVLREEQTGQLLSSPAQDTVLEGIDRIRVTDLELKAGGFYKINVLLEIAENGVASGDAESKIGKLYFIVGKDIDTDAG